MKLKSTYSAYLDYTQPNVDIILDKNINMSLFFS